MADVQEYRFDGSTWVEINPVPASHNHDDRYYTESESDALYWKARYCRIVDSTSTAGTTWGKVFSWTAPDASYVDWNITFLVSYGANNLYKKRYGILTLGIRESNNLTLSSGSQSLLWQYKTADLDENDFYLNVNENTVELWVKTVAQYVGTTLNVISVSNTFGVSQPDSVSNTLNFYQVSSPADTALPTYGTNIVSVVPDGEFNSLTINDSLTVAGSATFNSNMYTKNIVPIASNTYYLGSDSINIEGIYGDGFRLTSNQGSIELGKLTTTSSPFIDFHTDGLSTTDYNVRLIAHSTDLAFKSKSPSGSFRPEVPSVYNLGNSTYRWADIFSYLGNFSGQIVSSLATGTSPFAVSSTTLNTNLNADMLDDKHLSDMYLYRHASIVDTNETSGTTWGKIADITLPVLTIDRTISFMVVGGHGDDYIGELFIRIQNNKSSTDLNAVTSYAHWHTLRKSTYFNENNVVLILDGLTASIWVKTSLIRYDRIYFISMSEIDTAGSSTLGSWNLYSITNPTLTDLSTISGTQKVSTVDTLANDVSGNSATATKLQTARTIAGVSFDGTANISIPITGLSDTLISSPTSGQVLKYNGAHWINSTDNSDNYYLSAVSGSGNGTVTFYRSGTTSLTWDSSHGHSASEISGLGTGATATNVIKMVSFSSGTMTIEVL